MKKILIVDDVTDFSSLVKRNIELVGDYEVTCARTGEEGIRFAREWEPAVILMDIAMPQMDGLEALKKLKENKKTRSIPVIMLTARSDDEARLKASRLHNDGYIVKPFKLSELEEKMEGVLDRNED